MAEGNERLKTIVIGGGHFGKFHVEKYARHPEVELVGVLDAAPGVAEALTARWGGVAYPTLEALPEGIDLASVATPAGTHGVLARKLLEGGMDVLVEKPVATELETARGLVDLAKARDRILQVNHQERYFLAEAGLPAGLGKIRAARVRRLGPPPPKGSDCSVILDIVIHDLDWIRAFVPGEIVRIEVVRAVRGASGLLETVAARLEGESGIGIEVEASREHGERRREAVIETEKGRFTINFVEREVVGPDGVARYPGSREEEASLYGNHPFEAEDFVGKSVAHFIHCARAGRTPLVDGVAGTRALETALALERACYSFVGDTL